MSNDSEDFIIAVMAKDRPGIIAAIAQTVFELGGNVTELSQTVMGGYFTLILRATLPAVREENVIKQRLEGDWPQLGLTACVRRYTPERLFEPELDTAAYFLTMQGGDRPGLIARITRYLAGRQINIEDLYTRTEGDAITLILQIRPQNRRSAEQLREDLDKLGEELGIEIHLLHHDILRATSEVGAIRRMVRQGGCQS